MTTRIHDTATCIVYTYTAQEYPINMKYWTGFFVFVFLALAESTNYRRVCYYPSSSPGSPGVWKLSPRDIDPFLCTHIIFAFAEIKDNQLSPANENDENAYVFFNDLKDINPQLKTLLAVGGWDQASIQFSPMANDPENRRLFAETSVYFLRRYGFDGLDLDWEYPSLRDGANVHEDKRNFVLLCNELREAFDSEANEMGVDRLLLSSAVAGGKTTIDTSYNVPAMVKYLDFVNIMTYDLHGSWDNFADHNSPLMPRSDERRTDRYLNMNWIGNYWISLGMPAKMINIGFATYGRGFTLMDSKHSTFRAPTTGPSEMGPVTRTPGVLAYFEICDKLAKGGKRYWGGENKVPYYVHGKEWIGYDDEESISHKVRWLVREGYGGAMVWSLALDDFNQMCTSSQNKFPLIQRIKDDLTSAEIDL